MALGSYHLADHIDRLVDSDPSDAGCLWDRQTFTLRFNDQSRLRPGGFCVDGDHQGDLEGKAWCKEKVNEFPPLLSFIDRIRWIQEKPSRFLLERASYSLVNLSVIF